MTGDIIFIKNYLILLLTFYLLLSCSVYAQAPEFRWINSSGGIGLDAADAVAVDEDGNVYVTGQFNGQANFGSTILQSNGYQDMFLAKYNKFGQPIWAKHAGGSDPRGDNGADLALDHDGNILVTGVYCGSINFGTISLNGFGHEDIFLAKYDQNGNVLWARNAGGMYWDTGRSLAIDSKGNILITGVFGAMATFGNQTITNFANSDLFIAKYDSGGQILWVKNAGGYEFDIGCGVSVDAADNIYLTGYFQDVAFFDSIQIEAAGTQLNYDIFIASYNTNGKVRWAKSEGTDDIRGDFSTGISTAPNGNSSITGYFWSEGLFSASEGKYVNKENIIILHFDKDGTTIWQKNIGGQGADHGQAVVVDNNSNTYVTGGFSGNVLFDNTILSSPFGSNIFIAKYTSGGNLSWAIQADQSRNCNGYGIALDNLNIPHIAGVFDSLTIFGNQTLYSNGDFDIFITKLTSGNISIIEDEKQIPADFILQQNFPNPFNPETTIRLSVPLQSKIKIEIFNINGELVSEILNKELSTGVYSVTWDGKDKNDQTISSGIYYYRLISDTGFSETKRMIFFK